MKNISFGTRVLNGFLSVMVIALICMLVAVIVCLVLAAIGFF